MARIRSRAQGKAVRLSRETKQFLDWKHYVRLFPWAVVGTAAVAGYLMVPARRPAPVEPGDMPIRPVEAPRPEVRQRSMFSALTGIAMNAVMRSAVAYAGQAVGEYLASVQQDFANRSNQDPSHHDFASTR